MRVFYSEDYIAAAESFDTTRKSGWLAKSLVSDPIEGVELVAPQPLTFDDMAAAHDPVYVASVQSGEPRYLAESQGFAWDRGMWPMVAASNGGALAAARAAVRDGISGSLSSGLHHARFGSGAAYCTFNGLAIAARVMLDKGVDYVLILDLDAHCGGGTHSMIEGEPRIRQIDVSVSSVDHYDPAGANTLDLVEAADEYLAIIERRLSGLDRTMPTIGLCVYNAGMDPDERCSIGGLRGITAAMLREREAMVFEWSVGRGIPIAFVLAGGYAGGALSESNLVSLHRMTIEAAAFSASK